MSKDIKTIKTIEAILENNDGINLQKLYTSIFDNVKNLNNEQLKEIGKDFEYFFQKHTSSGGTRRKTKRKMRRIKGKSRKYWYGIGGDDEVFSCSVCLEDFTKEQRDKSISLDDLPNINIPNDLADKDKPILRHTLNPKEGSTSHYFHGKCLYDWLNLRPIGERDKKIDCMICKNELSSDIVSAILEKYATANDIVEFNRLQIRTRRESYLRTFIVLMCIFLTGLLFYLFFIELGNNGLNSLNSFFIGLVNLFLPMLRNFDGFNDLIRLFSDTIRQNYPALWYILCLHDPAFCGNRPLILRGGNVNVNKKKMKREIEDEIEHIKKFLIKMLSKLIEYNKNENTEEIQKFILFLEKKNTEEIQKFILFLEKKNNKERPNNLSRSKNLSTGLDESVKTKFTRSVKDKPF
jgi:hypothetical protein